MSDTVGELTLHAICRPATIVVPSACARRFTADPTFRFENTNLRVAASRGRVEAVRVLFQSSKNLGRCLSDIRDGLERKLLRMSVILLFVGSLGWCWPVLSELRSLILVSPAAARFTRVFPIASVLIGVGEKPIPKSENWIRSAARPTHPQPIRMGRGGRAQGSAVRAARGLWLANGAACRPGSSSAVMHGRNMRRKS